MAMIMKRREKQGNLKDDGKDKKKMYYFSFNLNGKREIADENWKVLVEIAYLVVQYSFIQLGIHLLSIILRTFFNSLQYLSCFPPGMKLWVLHQPDLLTRRLN